MALSGNLWPNRSRKLVRGYTQRRNDRDRGWPHQTRPPRPAQALRKSAIKTERSRWNIKAHPCPSSQTPDTNVTPNSSSQAYATVNLKPTANPISKLDTAPEIPTVPVDQPRHPPAACYPKLSIASENSNNSLPATQPSPSRKWSKN